MKSLEEAATMCGPRSAAASVALCLKPLPLSDREKLATKKLSTAFPPLVPVDIWTSTALPPALTGPEAQETAIANLPMSNNPGGCDIDGEFYMDGMKVGEGSNTFVM